MRRNINLAGLAVVMGAMLLALCSCDELLSSKEVQLNGNTAVWPEKSQYVSVASGSDLVRFDGRYPLGWPERFNIPGDTRFKGGPKLKAESSSNPDPNFSGIKHFRIYGITDMTPDELEQFFRSEIEEIGRSIATEDEGGRVKIEGTNMRTCPAKTLVTDTSHGRLMHISMTIEKHPDVKSHTAFALQVTVNANQKLAGN